MAQREGRHVRVAAQSRHEVTAVRGDDAHGMAAACQPGREIHARGDAAAPLRRGVEQDDAHASPGRGHAGGRRYATRLVPARCTSGSFARSRFSARYTSRVVAQRSR